MRRVYVTMGAVVLATIVGGEGCSRQAPASVPLAHTATAPAKPTTAPAVEVVIFTPPATLPAALPATVPVGPVHATTRPALIPAVAVAAPATLPATQAVAAPVHARVVSATLPAVATTTGPATALATAPVDVSAVFSAQMRRVLAGEAIQSEAFADLPPADRDAAVAMLDGLAKAVKQMHEGGIRSAAGAFVEAADKIRNMVSLQINNVALCTRVDGFKSYQEMRAEFPAMAATNTVLYCEMAGFTSRAGDRAQYETQLVEEVSLENEKGETLWQDQPNTMVDTSPDLRRDFYLARVVRLPDNIPAGSYRLKVLVTDQFSKQVAKATLPVKYVATP